VQGHGHDVASSDVEVFILAAVREEIEIKRKKKREC
jgi:hypothetical protein